MKTNVTTQAPTADEVRAARIAAGLNQSQACELVHLKDNVRWSEYENEGRRMDPARFELFLIKTNAHPDFIRRKTAGRKPRDAALAV